MSEISDKTIIDEIQQDVSSGLNAADIKDCVRTPSSISEEGLSGLVHRTWHPEDIKNRPLNVRSFQSILTGLQVSADIATIVLSFFIGYWAWNYWVAGFSPAVYQPMAFSDLYFSLGVALISCLIGFKVNGLYQAYRSILNVREFETILRTCLIACAISLSIIFLSKEQFFSRTVFGVTWISMVVLLTIQRYLFFRFQSYLRKCGISQSTVLIYGAGVVGGKLLDKLRQSPKLGLNVAGYLDDDTAFHGYKISGVPVLGGFSDLKAVLHETGARKLFVALPQVPQKIVEEILKTCKKADCEVQIVPYLYDIVVQRVKLSEVDGVPLIGMTEPRYSIRTMIAKKIFDLFISAILLILLSPVFFAIAIGVKLSSEGPIIFKQKRVGKNGKKFVFYKFRTMYTNTPIYAQTPKNSKDARIFPFGKFLRRTSLDELPQLINVIKGDMSLVGPRPEMPFIVSKYNDLHRQRLNVLPGITGLWQISADRKLAIHENMDYDIYYINNQSFLLDIVIMIKTAWSCVYGIGAY